MGQYYPSTCMFCDHVQEVPTYEEYKCEKCGQRYEYNEGHSPVLTPQQITTLRRLVHDKKTAASESVGHIIIEPVWTQVKVVKNLYVTGIVFGHDNGYRYFAYAGHTMGQVLSGSATHSDLEYAKKDVQAKMTEVENHIFGVMKNETKPVTEKESE